MHLLRNGFLAHYVDQMDISTIVQRHPDPILVVNEQNEIVYANTAGARLLCRLPSNNGFILDGLSPQNGINFTANITDLTAQPISFEVSRLNIQWQNEPACLLCLHDITDHSKYCDELEQLLTGANIILAG